VKLGPRVAAHVATTRHLCGAYPLVTEAGLGGDGVLIGRDVLGGSFIYDPFALYRQGVVTKVTCSCMTVRDILAACEQPFTPG
jgi:hypothetical protein